MILSIHLGAWMIPLAITILGFPIVLAVVIWEDKTNRWFSTIVALMTFWMWIAASVVSWLMFFVMTRRLLS